MSIRSEVNHVERNGLERALRREWKLTLLALLLLTFLLSYFGQHVGTQRLDYLLYDRTMALSTHTPSSDIVIVALDEDSIQELGYWPWRRATHAQLLSRLDGARAVGLDLVLTEPNPAYPEDDKTLAHAIRTHGRVVLPLVLDAGRVNEPVPVLAQAAASLGYINVQPDPDSVVRALHLYQLVADQRVQHFVVAMQAAASLPAHYPSLGEAYRRSSLISYSGGAGTYQMYPYARVLDGSVPPSAFQDKYVLVGAWASALGDTLSVPLSDEGEPMAGVEILANGLQNALQDSWVKTPSRLQAALLCLLPVLLACVALRRLSPRRSFFVVLFVVALIFTFNWLLMRYLGYWVGPSAALIGIVLAYPLWSWRSQQVTLQRVDRELDQLYEQNLMHGQVSGGSADRTLGGSLPARMVKLHRAIGVLRQAIAQREEALRFLSHDMRSPLNAILALTQLQRHGTTSLSQAQLLERVDKGATRTLDLVDGFVRLARAESGALAFHDVDLADLLQRVCDERWPMAQRRNITIAVDLPPGLAYVMADDDMLARALGNLVDNAIHYSADETRINCRLFERNGSWVIEVRDQGRGMTPEQRANLFEPFRRFDEDTPGNPDGSGLGLALVHTVMQRHGGYVEVESERGCGSVFRLVFKSP